MKKKFQYEYALCMLVSKLFDTVKCRSMAIRNLELQFLDLPDRSRDFLCKKAVVADIMMLIERDVIGQITFPMMHICAAEVRIITENSGLHTFIFTDGIYGFSVRLDGFRNGIPTSIQVEDQGCVHTSNTIGMGETKAALSSAA